MRASNKLPTEISTTDLAKLLGITTARVGQLTGQGILTHTQRGLYDPVIAVQAYLAFKVRSAGAALGPGYAAARTTFMTERAKLARLERLEREGELIPREQLEPAWVMAYAAVRGKFLGLPSKAGSRWGMCKSAAEATAMLRQMVNEILDGIATMPVLIAGSDQPIEAEEHADGPPIGPSH